MKTYTVKPLGWRESRTTTGWWYARTLFGPIAVFNDGMEWHWQTLDGEECPCESLADGKAQAEAYYLSRLLPALEEVATPACEPDHERATGEERT